MHKRDMQTVIRRNGHLQLAGDESTEELRHAILYLRQHTYMRCQRPTMGIPIESLIPDISVLAPRSIGSKNAKTQTVDIKDERL